ncbi:MAG: hypothetical protein K0Q55_2415 [Verrucomicrobia bacterium]|jgi:hypothetical protein|nr:hypothetical protein [Verrucomicrobiota bacterium]
MVVLGVERDCRSEEVIREWIANRQWPTAKRVRMEDLGNFKEGKFGAVRTWVTLFFYLVKNWGVDGVLKT